MNTQHTPGPWVAHLNMPLALVPGHLIKTGDDVARPIALIPEGGGTHGKPEQAANARLIAAAPELLSALKTVLNIAQVNMEGYTTTERNQIFEAESLLASLTSPKNS